MVDELDLRAVTRGVIVFVVLLIAYTLLGFLFAQIASGLGTTDPMIGGVMYFLDRLLWIASVMVPGAFAGRAAGKHFFLHGAVVGGIGGILTVLFLYLWFLALGGPSPFDSGLPLNLLLMVLLCGFGAIAGEPRVKLVAPSPSAVHPEAAAKPELLREGRDEEALHRAGLALYNKARKKSGEEAAVLYQAACEKYAAALMIKPDNPKVMNDWGVVLLEQARGKTPEQSEVFYAQAQEQFFAAEALKLGIASYNLACIRSLRGEYEECQRHLEAARKHKALPSLNHIKRDPDLDNVRGLEWFQKFMKTVRAK